MQHAVVGNSKRGLVLPPRDKNFVKGSVAASLGSRTWAPVSAPESRAGMGPPRADPWSSVLTEEMEAQKGKDHS